MSLRTLHHVPSASHLSEDNLKMPALVYPYAPSDHEPSFRRVVNAEPLEIKHLPRSLIRPSKSRDSRPPLLHLGWPMNQEKLLEWAINEGFEVFTEDVNARPVRDEYASMDAAIAYFVQRSNATPLRPYIRHTCYWKAPCIIAVDRSTNCSMSPEQSDIWSHIVQMDHFKLWLHKEGLLAREDMTPKWYLDYKYWKWSTYYPPGPKTESTKSRPSRTKPVDNS